MVALARGADHGHFHEVTSADKPHLEVPLPRSNVGSLELAVQVL